MRDILTDYREWRDRQPDRIGTHSDRCHMRHERCMIHRLAAALAAEQAKRTPQSSSTPGEGTSQSGCALRGSLRIERCAVAVRLLELRPGLFVDTFGVVGFKQQPQCSPRLMAKFLSDPALMDVFCADTGEEYWGGTEFRNERAALWVYPASICE